VKLDQAASQKQIFKKERRKTLSKKETNKPRREP
jgi:hypothetical protein